MSYTCVYLFKARQELLAAWEWYENKQPGLGERYKQEVDKCINKIESNPNHYPSKIRDYKEIQTDIFPYLVIYQVLESEKLVLIISVFHTSRHPQKKLR